MLHRLYGDDEEWIAYEMGEVTREMQREAMFRQENGKYGSLNKLIN